MKRTFLCLFLNSLGVTKVTLNRQKEYEGVSGSCQWPIWQKIAQNSTCDLFQFERLKLKLKVSLHKQRFLAKTSVISHCNQDKSAARFCCQVAAWITDMFCSFYSVEHHKRADNSPTPASR
jgi:hypothetical protein